MNASICTVRVCFLVSVLSLSCTDHREVPGLPGPSSCQIVQEVIKTQTSVTGIVYPGSPPFEETILLDESNAGSPLPILLPLNNILTLATTRTNTYRYNSQGQLIQETRASIGNPPERNPEITTYEYTASTLKITPLGFINPDGSPVIYNYTLNDKGLIATSNLYDGRQTYTYDAADYLTQVTSINSVGDTIKKLYTIEGGNVAKVVITGFNFSQTLTYDYDLTKPNLPNTRTVLSGQIFADTENEANQSRNLPIKRVDESNSTQQTSSGPGNIRLINTYYYTYTFDGQNRVKRRLRVHTYQSSINGSPLQNPILRGAFTIDYTYNCLPN